MTYNVFGGTLNLAQFSLLKFTHFAVTVHCEIHWERVPYLSALEVCSWWGAIQIYVYLYFRWIVVTIIVQIIDIFHCMSCFLLNLIEEPLVLWVLATSKIFAVKVRVCQTAVVSFNHYTPLVVSDMLYTRDGQTFPDVGHMEHHYNL